MIRRLIYAIALSGLCYSGSWAMPNPAAVYCASQGHELLLLQDAGFCRFADNSYCEEWGYYRAECFSGQHFWPDRKFTRNNLSQYCVIKRPSGPPQVALCQEQNRKLLQALQQQQYHGFLNISDYHLSAQERLGVFTALKSNKSVKGLSISSALTARELIAVIEMLKVNTTLSAITLQGQTLSLDNAVMLAQAISCHPSLYEVNLDNNGLTDKVFAAIFPGLASSARLQSLSLANNQLTRLSEQLLIKTLETNESLLTLNLSFNQLGNRLGSALLKLLARNNTLIQIGLQNTAISDQIIAQISAILAPRFRDSPCLTKNG